VEAEPWRQAKALFISSCKCVAHITFHAVQGPL
jgi:hypothetical protein